MDVRILVWMAASAMAFLTHANAQPNAFSEHGFVTAVLPSCPINGITANQAVRLGLAPLRQGE